VKEGGYARGEARSAKGTPWLLDFGKREKMGILKRIRGRSFDLSRIGKKAPGNCDGENSMRGKVGKIGRRGRRREDSVKRDHVDFVQPTSHDSRGKKKGGKKQNGGGLRYTPAIFYVSGNKVNERDKRVMTPQA